MECNIIKTLRFFFISNHITDMSGTCCRLIIFIVGTSLGITLLTVGAILAPLGHVRYNNEKYCQDYCIFGDCFIESKVSRDVTRRNGYLVELLVCMIKIVACVLISE